ncbi:hypothetical protein NC653_036690 [Populus alba x Populus x berolinensis]|uniref:Uncharacterized protein n=1 Tax=Populus alba x Populus x berolinensis TaxID=444605 RepID=A0AAD6PV80_9ROSI|nr:hypothetical protein NC653_036690 [Populus alba x Populus x berolinensis]
MGLTAVDDWYRFLRLLGPRLPSLMITMASPIVTFIDTPGAYADLKSEELGQAAEKLKITGPELCKLQIADESYL